MVTINIETSFGKKYKPDADHTDRHVMQSNGFNLLCAGYSNNRFIACGIPAMLIK